MKDDGLYLVHALECIERINEKIKIGGKDGFLNDRDTMEIILYNLQIMAESVQRISAFAKASDPQSIGKP